MAEENKEVVEETTEQLVEEVADDQGKVLYTLITLKY